MEFNGDKYHTLIEVYFTEEGSVNDVVMQSQEIGRHFTFSSKTKQ